MRQVKASPGLLPQRRSMRSLLQACVGLMVVAGALPAQCPPNWWPGEGFDMRGGSATDAVDALAEMPNGDIVAGGQFSIAGGVAVNNIARWDGQVRTPVGNGIQGGAVRALAVLPNGDPLLSDFSPGFRCCTRPSRASPRMLSQGIEFPQCSQVVQPCAIVSPQWRQAVVLRREVPQCLQNRAGSSLCTWHLAQRILLDPAAAAAAPVVRRLPCEADASVSSDSSVSPSKCSDWPGKISIALCLVHDAALALPDLLKTLRPTTSAIATKTIQNQAGGP
jgi:hypothetical protein